MVQNLSAVSTFFRIQGFLNLDHSTIGPSRRKLSGFQAKRLAFFGETQPHELQQVKTPLS